MEGTAGNGAAKVTSTGIALVEEGEWIVRAGSEAQAEQVADDALTTIHYYFPVEIEVVSGGEQIDPQHIADLALERLARSVRATKV